MTDQPKRSRWKRRALKLTLGLVFAVVAYGGAYLAVLAPVALTVEISESGKSIPEIKHVYMPAYRSPGNVVSDETLARIFWPALWVDYAMRPSRWSEWIGPYGVEYGIEAIPSVDTSAAPEFLALPNTHD